MRRPDFSVSRQKRRRGRDPGRGLWPGRPGVVTESLSYEEIEIRPAQGRQEFMPLRVNPSSASSPQYGVTLCLWNGSDSPGGRKWCLVVFFCAIIHRE